MHLSYSALPQPWTFLYCTRDPWGGIFEVLKINKSHSVQSDLIYKMSVCQMRGRPISGRRENLCYHIFMNQQQALIAMLQEKDQPPSNQVRLRVSQPFSSTPKTNDVHRSALTHAPPHKCTPTVTEELH